jgi:hypothetical protein
LRHQSEHYDLPLSYADHPRFDKTRIFSRSLKGLLDFAANAKAGASESSSARIIVPDDLSSPEKSQKTAIATFVSILQDLLDTKVEYINVGKIWEKSPPSEASNEGMQAYMQKVSRLQQKDLTDRLGTFPVMVL